MHNGLIVFLLLHDLYFKDCPATVHLVWPLIGAHNIEILIINKCFLIHLYTFFLVDKCAKCDPHAKCLNGHCKCRPGYYGNGYECIRGKV